VTGRTISTLRITVGSNQAASTMPPVRPSSTNGIFVYNTTRQGWEIPAAQRTARNLPNVVIINSPVDFIDIIDGMLASSNSSGDIKAYLNLLAIPQPIIESNPDYDPANPGTTPPTIIVPRTDTAGFTFVIDVRSITSNKG
jgi:hypothetical protein